MSGASTCTWAIAPDPLMASITSSPACALEARRQPLTVEQHVTDDENANAIVARSAFCLKGSSKFHRLSLS